MLFVVDDNNGSTSIDILNHIHNMLEVGKIFKSEGEAYNAYNVYAISKGFEVRKGQKFWRRSNELALCIFLCSCEGKSSVLASYKERKRQRLEYRCGCRARIKFKFFNGLWEVVELRDTRNHSI